MKVLYIGHYREASGWGQAARDYILALDRVGITVVPQSINLSNSNFPLPERILELEKQDISNCEVCIQHVLPKYMKHNSYFRKNIGLFVLETTHIKHTSWPNYLNLMDEIWVPCSSMIKDSHNSNILKPIKLVPHTFDTSEYTKLYPKLNLPTENKFVFYFIGEYNRRKNIAALIKAFHTEFLISEPVELVLKINKPGMSTEQLSNDFKNFCNKIKDGLRLYKDPHRYKPEIIITVNVSREDILRLHQSCDCFVMPSYGEGFSIPTFESMAMGNLVISSATGAMVDYITSERNGFLVNGSMEPVFGQFETVEEFGTSREQWFNISVLQLMKTMRRVYEMDEDRKNKIRLEAKLSAGQYDYSKIGQHMKELLSV